MGPTIVAPKQNAAYNKQSLSVWRSLGFVVATYRLDKNHFNSLSQGHKVECTPAKVVIPAEVAVQEKAREVNLLQSIAAAFNEIVQNYKSYKPY